MHNFSHVHVIVHIVYIINLLQLASGHGVKTVQIIVHTVFLDMVAAKNVHANNISNVIQYMAVRM